MAINISIINDFTNSIGSTLVNWRRELHQIPELGWCEYQTTSYIYEQLKSLSFEIYCGREVLNSRGRMGLPSKETDKLFFSLAQKGNISSDLLKKMKGGYTGLIAQFDTGKEGKHMAFRFDIDGLEVLEDNREAHIPAKKKFRSLHEQTMHACGHDGHITVGLGLASFIATFAERLTGRYTLIFQPAEEGVSGAKAIVEKGWLDDVDLFISGHIFNEKIGTIVATSDSFLATTKINVTFRGSAAHAGISPQKGKNALLAAASASLNLHAISRSGVGETRINVGKLIAGTGRNIIPNYSYMEIETRGETSEVNEYMVNEAIRILKSAAKMYDTKIKIEVVGHSPSASSDEEWIDIVKIALAGSTQVKEVINRVSITGSEDVTFMMKRVQQRGGIATYLLYGGELVEDHHKSGFDFNEEVLLVGLNTLAALVAFCNSK